MLDGDTVGKELRDLDNAGPETFERSRKLEDFMRRVFGSSAEHTDGTFSDWTTTFRRQIILTLADKVNEIHRRRGIADQTVPIPPRLAIPLLQKATLEDDETLQDMWAALIANAMDPRCRSGARRTLIDLLASLEPADAQALWSISRDGEANPNRHALFYDAALARKAEKPCTLVEARNLDWVAKSAGMTREVAALSVESLARLGLIGDLMPAELLSAIPVPVTHPSATLELTSTGRLLVLMCSAGLNPARLDAMSATTPAFDRD
jgi:hypothetical protein